MEKLAFSYSWGKFAIWKVVQKSFGSRRQWATLQLVIQLVRVMTDVEDCISEQSSERVEDATRGQAKQAPALLLILVAGGFNQGNRG